MPDWLLQLLIAGGGLGAIGTAIASVYKAHREDKERRAKLIEEQRIAQNQRIDRLYEKVESLLRDAVAREKEYNAQNRERIEMDAQLKEVVSVVTGALKEAAAELSRIKKS